MITALFKYFMYGIDSINFFIWYLSKYCLVTISGNSPQGHGRDSQGSS